MHIYKNTHTFKCYNNMGNFFSLSRYICVYICFSIQQKSKGFFHYTFSENTHAYPFIWQNACIAHFQCKGLWMWFSYHPKHYYNVFFRSLPPFFFTCVLLFCFVFTEPLLLCKYHINSRKHVKLCMSCIGIVYLWYTHSHIQKGLCIHIHSPKLLVF